jgi:hypothetical protein
MEELTMLKPSKVREATYASGRKNEGQYTLDYRFKFKDFSWHSKENHLNILLKANSLTINGITVNSLILPLWQSLIVLLTQ